MKYIICEGCFENLENERDNIETFQRDCGNNYICIRMIEDLENE